MPYGPHPNVHKAPADALAEPGLYLLKVKGQDPNSIVPVFSVGGKFYAVVMAQELPLDGFHPQAWLEGPFA